MGSIVKLKKRKKASDIFRNTNYVFSKKVSFKEAFPQINKIIVEVTEIGKGIHEPGERIYTENDISEYIDCSNPICYNGGVRIGDIIRKMAKNNETELITTEMCQGYEGSPQGKRFYRRCLNSFKIKVTINYKR